MSSTPEAPHEDLPPDFETVLPDDLDVRYCYRHPQRETGVSCSNCGRPICHECMILAPVGFRCPECVKQQQVRGSRAKVVTRGQMRSRWSASGAAGQAGWSVTKVLVALNVIMFVVELATGATRVMGGGSARAMIDLGALYLPSVFDGQQYWRMVTAMFLHDGILHLGFNMWALWVIGGFLEAAVGRLKFAILYFVSGVAGSTLVLIAAPPNSLVVGASGAVFGVFGALAVHAFLNRGRDFQSRALLGNILFLLAINLMFTFTAGMISWQAHIGGLVAGAATMLALTLGGRKDARAPFGVADAACIVAIVLVIVALAGWRVATYVA